ncbi:UNVERIFIED_CONTAM: transmembrane protein [Trichonephila clavipes]
MNIKNPGRFIILQPCLKRMLYFKRNWSVIVFFPTVIQPPLIVISNAVFGFLVYVKLCKKPIRKYNLATSTSVILNIPGTEPHDAERRR